MTGGFSDKMGNWYEQDYVVLLWLRLLLHQVQSVTWEPAGEDEHGVDGLFEAEGRRIAFQCKSRETGNWSPSAIKISGVLGHARRQLEREDGPDRFLFVTTTDAPSIRRLRRKLDGWSDAGPSLEIDNQDGSLIEAFEDADLLEDPGRLKALLARIEVYPLGLPPLRDYIDTTAAALAGTESERLVSCLKAIRAEPVLRVRLRAPNLRERLPADLAERLNTELPDLRTEAKSLVQRFLAQAEREQRIEPAIDRPEAAELASALRDGAAGRIILVHGMPGVGKSQVIASALRDHTVEPGIVVAIRADEGEFLLGERFSLKQLGLVAAGERVTVVIDQIDQILLAGSETQRHLRLLEQVRREATDLGFMVVLGCRTTDARHESQLRGIMGANDAAEVLEIEVGNLAVEAVTPVLSRVGIAWNSLGAAVQKLVRIPICLSLIQELASEQGWQGSRTLHQFVCRWWQFISHGDPALEQALDAVIKRMESNGELSIDPLTLPGHDAALGQLQENGVLIADGGRRLRPVHQVLMDMRLAQRIGTCETTREVLERLGSRVDQDMHVARRLRHAVTILAHDGGRGPQILDEIFLSPKVRPLVKRALLLGLADERAPLPPPLLEVVRRWLESRSTFIAVSQTVFLGNGDWMRAAQGWLGALWERGDETRRDTLLWLLTAVAVQEGDLVATLLRSWAENESAVLERVGWIFWQDPSDDSDELFRLRMAAPGRVGLPQDHFRWKKLFAGNPERAATLLGAQLQEMTLDDLVTARCGHDRLPMQSDFPESALTSAAELWVALQNWWLGLEIESLGLLHSSEGKPPASAIVPLVEILARCLAHELDGGRLAWDDLVEQLPYPLRDLDGWLLFATGARLSGTSIETACAAGSWLTHNDRLVGIKIGSQSRITDHLLLREFVRAISPSLPDRALARLENWVLDYSEPYVGPDEETRLARAAVTGDLWPNKRGVLAYRVLPEFPRSRLSLRAERRLHECKRKFDPVSDTMLGSRIAGERPRTDPKIRTLTLRTWNTKRWLAELRHAPESASHPSTRSEHHQAHDLRTLSRELQRLAHANPQRFLPVAYAVAAASPPIDGNVRADLLAAIGEQQPPSDSADPSAWSGLDDALMIAVSSEPAYLNEESCSVELSRIVAARSKATWPEPVIDRLVARAAQSPPEESTVRLSLRDLDTAQWGDPACAAMSALSALACHHTDLHAALLALVDRLVDSGPLTRRAASVGLAMCCWESDPTKAQTLVLRACRERWVAARTESRRAMFVLLDHAKTPEDVKDALTQTLIGLLDSHADDILERGGRAAIALRERDRITDSEIVALLAESSIARLGAVEGLGQRLDGNTPEGWALKLTLHFADDPDARVSNRMIFLLTRGSSCTWLRDLDFAHRILDTRGGQSCVGDLLRALDEEATLLPAAEYVLSLADQGLETLKRGDDEAIRPIGRSLTVGRLGSLLPRLIEECERRGNASAIRTRALDALDRLLETHPREMGGFLIAQTM